MRIPAFCMAILAYVVVGHALPAVAQVDQQRAQEYFKEVQALCERDGGRLDVQGGTGMGGSRRSTAGRLRSCSAAAVMRVHEVGI